MNIVANVRMTEAQYERERAKIAPTKREAMNEGGVRWEQQLAELFYRSGWSAPQLVAKERRSESAIKRLVLFGRFLGFAQHEANAENLPKNLNENRFRNYWNRTEGGGGRRDGGNERIRFLTIIKMMRGETILSRPSAHLNLGPAIKEKFGDGKWHPLETIADAIEAPEAKAHTSLNLMCQRGTYGVKAERKRVGASFHYRIFPQDKTVSVKELKEKLAPIIKELMLQGRANMATVSPPTVLYNAGKLQKLLDEWLGEDE
jgi:hypothetical protein